MEFRKNYKHLKFPETVLRRVISVVQSLAKDNKPGEFGTLEISNRGETWSYDDVEDFFAEFPKADDVNLRFSVPLTQEYWKCELSYSVSGCWVFISVRSQRRHEINSIINVFRESENQAIPFHVVESSGTEESDFKVFIGHGRSKVWEELKNHLQDKHGHHVVAFESGARAGHHIRDILDEMLTESSLAFLVLTGEDETADQCLRARQNVIHETGLFQGKLGFSRAIVLLEEGVEEFSNLAGIQHISFPKGHISETFGEVLAVIRRESDRLPRKSQ
ncbi:MAG: nucleotide-binding protein [Terracidiphilus sp.]